MQSLQFLLYLAHLPYTHLRLWTSVTYLLLLDCSACDMSCSAWLATHACGQPCVLHFWHINKKHQVHNAAQQQTCAQHPRQTHPMIPSKVLPAYSGLAFLAFGLNMVDCGNLLGQRLRPARPAAKKVAFNDDGLVANHPVNRTFTL